MEPSFAGIYLLTAAVYIFSLSLLCAAIFARRLPLALHRLTLCLTILCLYFLIVRLNFKAFYLRAGTFLLVSICSLFLYKGSFIARISIAMLHFVIAAASETITLPLMIRIKEVSINTLHQSFYRFAVCFIIPMLFSLLFCLGLSWNLSRRREIIQLPVWSWIMILFFALFSILELYISHTLLILVSSAAYPLSISGLMLLIMNIAVILFSEKLSTWYDKDKENFFLQEQIRYHKKNLAASAQAYESQRSLTHDFDNHILAAVQLLQNGESNSALDYLKQVRNSVESAETVVSTNNPIADAVLNQKYRKALDLGIHMQFFIDDLSQFPLAGDELAAVLSNLLDNALEASMKFDGKREIRVKLMNEPAATLSIQNTSPFVEVSPAGEVSTSKKDRRQHGYGLRNTRKILEKSGFEVALRYENGSFLVAAMKTL